ncbi:hypothetical protein EGW08_016380, partial [Elysia chlorotica]
WRVEIECSHLMHVYRAVDEDSFLRLSLQPPSTCLVYQRPPDAPTGDSQSSGESGSQAATTCSPRWFGPAVSSCNTTGLWASRDAAVEAACLAMDQQTLRVFDSRQDSDLYFRNVFCAICNTGDFPWFYATCDGKQDDGKVPVSSLPFSLLLGTQARSPMRRVLFSPFAECPAAQWAGPDGVCYPLTCAPGKLLDLDRKLCQSALPGVSGLGYSVRVHYSVRPRAALYSNSSLLYPGTRGSICTTVYAESFKQQVKTLFASVSAGGEFVLSIVLKNLTLVPGIVQVAVVASSLSLHDRLGYGKDGCFLDSSLLIWITVIAPLSFVLLCNLVFFSCSVWKIHSVRKLQSGESVRRDERQNLYIYVKLSTMTGAFWTVAILSETLASDPLRYVSIALNGLQGAFIFMSYIVNRRVLNLYLRAAGLERYIPEASTASTDRSTLAKAAS